MMNKRSQVRRFWSDHGWWVAIALAACTTFRFGQVLDARVDLALLAFAAMLFYQWHRQSAGDRQTFADLFLNFNKQYQPFNERLQAITDQGQMVSAEDRQTLQDYFNLCAEEYLCYRHGMIEPEVWQTWLAGMRDWLRCEAIADYWTHESKTGLYYGLEQALWSLPDAAEKPRLLAA